MRKLLLAATALTLGYTCAHAQEPKWQFNFRQCHVVRATQDDSEGLDLADALEIQKLIVRLKMCDAFWRCVNDREAGKVKHCYENDRRWQVNTRQTCHGIVTPTDVLGGSDYKLKLFGKNPMWCDAIISDWFEKDQVKRVQEACAGDAKCRIDGIVAGSGWFYWKKIFSVKEVR